MKKYALIGLLAILTAPALYGQCLLTYQTESVDAFFVGQHGNFQLIAVSGTPSYKFEIFEGTLPEGLHLTPSGRIIGTPVQEEEQVVLITVTDREGCQLTQAFIVVVFP